MEPLLPHPAEFKHRLAIDLALQHPALSTDPRILCRAAQTCKAWQQAVQQCNACNTVVVLGPAISLQQVCSFKRWLFQHPGLLKSLTANVCYVRHQEHHAEAVLALLQQAMQQALWTPAAAAAAAPPPAAGNKTQQTDGQQLHRQQQQQQQLRIASFTSNLPGAPSMLAALSGRHLTHLDLQLQCGSCKACKACNTADGPWLAAALPQLTGLQELHLKACCYMSGSCLVAI
uniref:F-box domain-containing protein n=1 Tax=Tetradesmus obliquus TaxID=3088 RepID=A0A383VY15_TETOB|eukprot:jgi/Sobl393_1/11806/SZX70367.1